MIRDVKVSDAKAILEIYSYYVINTIVSFELVPPSLGYMEEKIGSSEFPWLVYEEQGQVIGYSYATSWKAREAYKNSVETSVYLSNVARGRGIGKKLYDELLSILKQQGYHMIIGGISLPNEASVKLHESLGFQYVGAFKEVGHKFGEWVDVGYWQLHFEE